MAAGMGSRYGGLKQLDPVSPNGETIIDYSVFDAIRAGFNKVIFIIREEFENEFKNQITNKYKNKIEVEFVFQDLSNLPKGYNCPNGRLKPWGTGHAILSAKKLINEPFVVINGDDFYGFESFEVISKFYLSGKKEYSMVAFKLENTLSKFGAVSRGLCQVSEGFLNSVVETKELQRNKNLISSNRDINLNGSELVSMNMWGFTPKLFDYLEKKFPLFLDIYGDKLNSEFLIPSIVNDLIVSKTNRLLVLNSESNWFGVTYKEDKPNVVKEINKLIKKGKYPTILFK
tara:strand:- start:572 stop:1432 length:861 start_codon:yes stop_codon:yes gene_type:complete